MRAHGALQTVSIASNGNDGQLCDQTTKTPTMGLKTALTTLKDINPVCDSLHSEESDVTRRDIEGLSPCQSSRHGYVYAIHELQGHEY